MTGHFEIFGHKNDGFIRTFYKNIIFFNNGIMIGATV